MAGAVLLFAVVAKSGLLGKLSPKSERKTQTIPADNIPADSIPADRGPVEHGNVADPSTLESHGKLYFVPMGRQAISPQSLAKYYRQKFNIKITVLPALKPSSLACEGGESKCIAEEMLIQTEEAFPEVSRDPDSVVIILTDEDIYPRSLGWNFTYSFHSGYHIGIVSSRRMDPTFWGDPPNQAILLASEKQMLTKYIAQMYFHVPISHDPTSVMYQPLTPNGAPDDLYESDLHSEESANGLRGSGWPCISYTYSYKTGELKTLSPVITDCDQISAPSSMDEETFQTELGRGQFIQRSMDLQLNSVPPIEFRRGYLSTYNVPMAFGYGANHDYNSWLNSDGAVNLTFIDIMHEDGSNDHLRRITPGRGFSANVAFESKDDGEEIYGSRMTWAGGRFKLTNRDGSWSTYLPCADSRCYWAGYQDSKGNSLRFDRGSRLELQRLTSQDQKGIEFQSDAQVRITDATATDGRHVSYVYSNAGDLTEVRRADGQITLYGYDRAHHMTSVAVQRPGQTPRVLITNEYDDQGWLVRQTLADGSVYTMEHGAIVNRVARRVALHEPSGLTLNIRLSDSDFEARSTPVRFAAKPTNPQDAQK
ncbi:MAG TPA: DUF6531 domain-containing protein [Candidatus Angelobacter sp.]|nr:DUF6531 domain-containing protein [Candidatus Angelobacter sp.]